MCNHCACGDTMYDECCEDCRKPDPVRIKAQSFETIYQEVPGQNIPIKLVVRSDRYSPEVVIALTPELAREIGEELSSQSLMARWGKVFAYGDSQEDSSEGD